MSSSKSSWLLKILDKTNLTVTALTACVVLYTRSAGIAYFAAGTLGCAISAKLIKDAIKQERPVHLAGKKRKTTYGMPSTHSSSIACYAAYVPLACLYLPIHHSLPQHWAMRVLPPLVIVPWAFLVAASRVWLGHHTRAQVIAGWLYGTAFTSVLFKLWISGLNVYGREAEQIWNWYIDKYIS